MTPNEIRAEIVRRGLSVTKLAEEANCSISQMSMCIGGSRIYPLIRQAIARRLGKPVDSIFGRHHPKPKRVSGSLADRKASAKQAA